MSVIGDLQRARRRAKLPLPRNLEFVYPILVVVAAVVGWQLWVSIGDVPQYQFPRLSQVVDVLVNSSVLLTVTLRPFEVGFFPIVVATQFVPLIALTPLFVIWMGFGSWPKLVMIMLFGKFSVLVTALTGLRGVEQEKLYLARSMGASPVDAFRRLRFPNALPAVFAGLRITWTSSVIGAVVSEFIVGSSGLGYVILRAQGVGDSATLVAGVVYLAVIGAVGFWLVTLAERLTVPWHASHRTTVASAL